MFFPKTLLDQFLDNVGSYKYHMAADSPQMDGFVVKFWIFPSCMLAHRGLNLVLGYISPKIVCRFSIKNMHMFFVI